MKKTIKRLCALAAAACLAAAFCLPAFAQDAPPAVSCGAYVVMDADTGQILIEQNPDQRMYPASTTKIMTLGLTAQKTGGNWDESVTVSEEAVYSLLHTDSSHIALQPGEVVPLKDVVYGTQLASANDGANVLATYIGGSIQGGVDAMNAQAQALGLTGTHFANPHGLHDPDHYTTARDLATITRWALQQPGFQDVFCYTGSWTMAPTNLQPQERYFACDDWLRVGNVCYREYAKGGKDGYHDVGGHSYVNYSEQDGVRLICVILGDVSKKDRYYDACALLDYCFGNFARAELPDEGKSLPLDVQGGGGVLGQVQVKGTAASVLLHSGRTAEECTVEYALPEVWNLGQPLSAWQVVHIPASEGQAESEVCLAMAADGLNELLAQAAEHSARQAQASSGGFTGLLAGAALAAVLLFGLVRVKPWKKLRKTAAAKPGGGVDFPILQWDGETTRMDSSIYRMPGHNGANGRGRKRK